MDTAVPVDEHRTRSAGERYARAMRAVVRRLPLGLSRIVAPTFLGFALINSGTFGIDLLLLWALHEPARWPLSLAVTAAYAVAFGLAYLLNRVLNFRSHAPVGPQLGVYVGVVVANYLVCVLGASTLLTGLGLDFRLARVVAGGCEAAFMYLAMRRLVFRDVR